ncbi:PorV/PorQ family protein [candidate division KSB1 bacterium]|nr:PorV/PorQ family protein [candidate division KSB1 bacterium]
MKQIITFMFIVACLFIAVDNIIAQQDENVSKAGTTSAPFLAIEAGARAIGMGGAFVAVSNDITSLYWNPAGLARLSTTGEATFNHTDWILDVSHDYAAVGLSLGSFGALGLSFSALTMGEMEVRSLLYPEGTGEKFGASDFAIGTSYARNLTDRFSIGFTAKYINQSLWHMSASSFAIDIGTLFTTQFNGMRIGMSISNFGNKMKLEGSDTQVPIDIDTQKYGNNNKIVASMKTDSWSLPLLFRFGVAMDVIKSYHQRWTLAVDAMHPNDNSEYLNLGTEYALNENVFLRAGYKNLFMTDNEEGLAAGMGLAYKFYGNIKLKIDYAYADFGVLENVQRLSFALEF